jgi:AcrR family transcriptional regulator
VNGVHFVEGEVNSVHPRERGAGAGVVGGGIVRGDRYGAGLRKLHMPHIQITYAALHIYASEGPKGLTMRRVGAAVGVRASALYRHFRNKEALIDSVVAAAEGRLAQKLERPRRQKPWVDRAAALAERALHFATEQPHLFQLVARRRPHWHRADGGDRAAALRREVESAMADGQLRRDDPDKAAGTLWAHLCGLVALRERGDLPVAGSVLRDAWVGSTRRLLHGMKAVKAA